MIFHTRTGKAIAYQDGRTDMHITTILSCIQVSIVHYSRTEWKHATAKQYNFYMQIPFPYPSPSQTHLPELPTEMQERALSSRKETKEAPPFAHLLRLFRPSIHRVVPIRQGRYRWFPQMWTRWSRRGIERIPIPRRRLRYGLSPTLHPRCGPALHRGPDATE